MGLSMFSFRVHRTLMTYFSKWSMTLLALYSTDKAELSTMVDIRTDCSQAGALISSNCGSLLNISQRMEWIMACADVWFSPNRPIMTSFHLSSA